MWSSDAAVVVTICFVNDMKRIASRMVELGYNRRTYQFIAIGWLELSLL